MKRRFLSQSAKCVPDFLYYPNAITLEESLQLYSDFQPKLEKKKYDSSHYDAVIQDYRETEISLRRWSEPSQVILRNLFTLAFSTCPFNAHRKFLPPHVLDLKPKTGCILPHVDSIKHGGGIVSCLSLLSSRKLRLTQPEGEYAQFASSLANHPPGTVLMEVEVEPLSLYVLRNVARYEMSHSIQRGEERRVSIVFRDEPEELPTWATSV